MPVSGIQESESEEDILDEIDDDFDEEHDHEPEPVVKKPVESPMVPRETERQLSKKERKKKELAELEALLADFGVTQGESNGHDESRGESCLSSAIFYFPYNLCLFSNISLPSFH